MIFNFFFIFTEFPLRQLIIFNRNKFGWLPSSHLIQRVIYYQTQIYQAHS